MNSMRYIKKAYTLAEVVIVMLIIAVIAGVSIKITKTKLDKVISYTYYSAYSSVSGVTRSMLLDNRREEDDQAQLVYQSKNILAKITDSIIMFFWNQPAYAALNNVRGCEALSDPTRTCRARTPEEWGDVGLSGTDCISSNGSGIAPGCCICTSKNNGAECITDSITGAQICTGAGGDEPEIINPDGLYCTLNGQKYSEGAIVKESACVSLKCMPSGSWSKTSTAPESCPSGSVLSADGCTCELKKDPNPEPTCGNKECPDGTFLKLSTCECLPRLEPSCKFLVCPSGQTFNSETCACEPSPNPGCEVKECLSGQTFNSETCACEPSPNPSCEVKECEAGQTFDSETCTCVTPDIPVNPDPDQPTILPTRGLNYCNLFRGYVNTKNLPAGLDECSGTQIDNNPVADGYFNSDSINPDFILRNGMKFYNAHQEPIRIPDLVGNSRGRNVQVNADGLTYDIDEWGYVLYIDIDGDKGPSTLWQDVFKFYVTLAGNVIPAFDTAHTGQFGGDNRFYLQTSVYDEYVDDSGRKKDWYATSESFKQSACVSGLVATNTPYCRSNPAVTRNANCTNDSHDCRIKIIKPTKMFF